jgi:hypothetical protein
MRRNYGEPIPSRLKEKGSQRGPPFNFTSGAGLGTETLCVGSFSDRREQFPRHDWHEARAFFFGRIPVSMRCYPSPGIITPKPAHSRMENGWSVFRIVGSSPHDQLIVIAFESQCSSHCPIGARPIQPSKLSWQAALGSILQKHAKPLHIRLLNQFAVRATASNGRRNFRWLRRLC